MACDSITDKSDQYIRLYDDKLAEKVELQEYITENIDRAIANGWIKVYYQPVVRSLSGALCGFEALTRWIDPAYGFMNPAVFIHTLEENHLIHKLDIYAVQQVAGNEEPDRMMLHAIDLLHRSYEEMMPVRS